MATIEFKEQNIEEIGSAKITSQESYVYKPKKDITAYELALIVPIFHTQYNVERVIGTLPAEAKRHFEEVK